MLAKIIDTETGRVLAVKSIARTDVIHFQLYQQTFLVSNMMETVVTFTTEKRKG